MSSVDHSSQRSCFNYGSAFHTPSLSFSPLSLSLFLFLFVAYIAVNKWVYICIYVYELWRYTIYRTPNYFSFK